jgi:hypothetical protein
LTALANDAVLSHILGQDAQKVQSLIITLAALIGRLRQGEFIPIPAMVKMLSAAE